MFRTAELKVNFGILSRESHPHCMTACEISFHILQLCGELWLQIKVWYIKKIVQQSDTKDIYILLFSQYESIRSGDRIYVRIDDCHLDSEDIIKSVF